MAMMSEDIERLIKLALPDAQIQIDDLVGDQNHYRAVIISASFQGKSRLEQHKMIYNALGPEMGNALHALTFKTQTPSI